MSAVGHRCRGRARIVVVAAAVLTLAGCGSTVPLGSAAYSGADGLNQAAPSANAQSAGSSTMSASSSSPGLGGSALGSSTGGPAGGAAPVSGGAGGSGASGPSSNASTGSAAGSEAGAAAAKVPVRVGVIYTPGVNSLAADMGINGLNTGDTKAEAQAVADWINAHGGLGGHPIQMFAYAADMSATSPDQVDEEACTAMSQDLKVRYVITITVPSPAMMPCLSKAGIGLLDDETGLDDTDMATYAKYLGNPGDIASGRMNSVLVNELWQRGWLTAASKVGILAADSAASQAVVNGPLMAALRSHGLTPKSTVFINPSGGDGGSSQSAGAVLKFRAASVDRVIPVDYSPLFMMEAANSQGYYPWYALNSSYGPGALLETAAPSSQLANSAGIGWQPFLDIGKGTMPPPVSSRQTLCFQIMSKAGQATNSATAEGFELQVCDVMFYLEDLSALMPTVPPDLLSTARPLLGRNFASADTFLVDVTHRTDGVAGYRPLGYETSCSCFQYVGPVERMPS